MPNRRVTGQSAPRKPTWMRNFTPVMDKRSLRAFPPEFKDAATEVVEARKRYHSARDRLNKMMNDTSD